MIFLAGHQCESSETTDVYYILIGAFFIKHVLKISPPTLQRLILSAMEISCVCNRFLVMETLYEIQYLYEDPDPHQLQPCVSHYRLL